MRPPILPTAYAGCRDAALHVRAATDGRGDVTVGSRRFRPALVACSRCTPIQAHTPPIHSFDRESQLPWCCTRTPGAVASAAVSRRVSGATRGFTYHACTPSRKGKEKKADRPASSHTAGYAGLCNTTLARDRGRSVRSCASSDWPPVVMQPGIGQQEGQNRREIYMRKYILRCQFVHPWHRVMESPIHSYLFALAREPAPLLLSPTR